jgi:hypothetical protein
MSGSFNVEVIEGGGSLDPFGEPQGSSVTVMATHHQEGGIYRITLRPETYHRNTGNQGDIWERDQECARLLHKVSREALGGVRGLSELELRGRGLPGWATAIYRQPGRAIKLLSDWALPNWLKGLLRYAIMWRIHETERRLAASFGTEIFVTYAEPGYVTAAENPAFRPRRNRGAASARADTSAQGHPVPIGYGELIVGSAVISAGVIAEDIPT